MSLLAALDTTQIVLIVLIGVLVIAYPLLMIRRNKKENQRMTEQTNSLKRGDKILTTSGVYGKIIDIKLDGTAKQVTIETGTDKFKSYMTVDAFAIYQVIKDQEPQVAKDITKTEEAPKVEEKADKKSKKAKAEETAPVAVVAEESKAEEVKAEEQKAEAKEVSKPAKARAKKATKAE